MYCICHIELLLNYTKGSIIYSFWLLNWELHPRWIPSLRILEIKAHEPLIKNHAVIIFRKRIRRGSKSVKLSMRWASNKAEKRQILQHRQWHSAMWKQGMDVRKSRPNVELTAHGHVNTGDKKRIPLTISREGGPTNFNYHQLWLLTFCNINILFYLSKI